MASISTGEARLSALSCSIQVSSRQRCNGRCKFCISRTTANIVEDKKIPESLLFDDEPNMKPEIKLCDSNRLKVGLNYARTLGASHAILTGKADPSQEDPNYLFNLVKLCREYLPLVDFHTNGLLLQVGRPQHDLTELLAMAGLTMITFSIASFDPDVNFRLMGVKQEPRVLIAHANELGLMVRCSLVANKSGVKDFAGVMEYIHQAGDLGAHAVVIREVWLPDQLLGDDKEVYDWNLANQVDIGKIQSDFESMVADKRNAFGSNAFDSVAVEKRNAYGLRIRDPLPWGTPVFTVDGVFNDKNHGVNVTFARCDEATTGRIIKSIVHKPDGHGYRNWDSNGDILY